MRGRKPKPTALKELAGNPGKRPLPQNEPKPGVPSSPPYAPRHLGSEAKREWRRLVPRLMAVGIFTELDYAALALYCEAYGRWVVAEEHLRADTEGEILVSEKGFRYINPWRTVANQAWEQMRKILVEFGMTPSSRSRVKVEKGEDLDPFEEYLRSIDE